MKNILLFVAIFSLAYCHGQKENQIEKAPEFPGGYRNYMKLLNRFSAYNIGYYLTENEFNIPERELKSYIILQIDKCGNVVDTKCKAHFFCSYLVDAVKKINKTEKWKPAESNGEPVECTYKIEYEISREEQRFVLLEFKDVKPVHKEKKYLAYGEPNPMLCGYGIVSTKPVGPPPKIVLPSFPGGLKNLYAFVYSKINRDAITPPCDGINKISIDILFTIDFKGRILDEDILFEGDTFAAEEVKKAVLLVNNYKKWNPATSNGKPFNTVYRLSLEFDLK